MTKKSIDRQARLALAKRLKTSREHLRIRQAEAADYLNVSRATIIAIEAGERNVSSLELTKLSKLYKRDLVYLLEGGVEDKTITFVCNPDENITKGDMTDKPTLRDQFAMAALTGLLARNGVYEVIEDVVIDSYRIADGMLKEREGLGNER